MDEHGEIINFYGIITDITDEVRLQEELNFFASHDTLTELPNQRSLYKIIDQLCENKRNRFAVLYLDLDRIDVINDSLGHEVGNELIKKVAERFTSTFPEDTYIARLNNNDFVILIDYVRKEDIFDLAEKVIATLEKKMTIKEYELFPISSIGISFFPSDGDEKLPLIRNAHAALYHAKQRGKNNYQLYSYSKDIYSYKQYELELDMRHAIENEEFEIYYQPQVDTYTGVLEGAEALLRWNHRNWGLVSPGEFIPLAEENHYIHEIGEWVIQTVCRELREWKDNGYTLRSISINISPIQFLKEGIVDYVRDQLEKYQIPAKYLEFEITENSLLKGEKQVLSTLSSLKELGVKIAIDDFGTGHASLNYLRELPVDTIKIDQVFVQSNDGQNELDQAIVSSVLYLAKTLEITTIAEGVEEYNQLEYLKQHECSLTQGYLFSKTVPKETFEKIMITGYMRPTKKKMNVIPEVERRAYYRFEFPSSVLGDMTILEVNDKKVDIGSANILIENISLGGIKFLSSLNLPIHSNLKLRFKFKIMDEEFDIEGELVWKNNGKGSSFFYGVKFNLIIPDEDRLANVINQMTAIRKRKQEIPDTDFIYEDAYVYLRKNSL